MDGVSMVHTITWRKRREGKRGTNPLVGYDICAMHSVEVRVLFTERYVTYQRAFTPAGAIWRDHRRPRWTTSGANKAWHGPHDAVSRVD